MKKRKGTTKNQLDDLPSIKFICVHDLFSHRVKKAGSVGSVHKSSKNYGDFKFCNTFKTA